MLQKGINIICQCIKCGYIKTTNKHCIEISCPKHGKTMRRKIRPGRGR